MTMRFLEQIQEQAESGDDSKLTELLEWVASQYPLAVLDEINGGEYSRRALKQWLIENELEG